MATSVIIRDLGGYAAPPAPLAQRESNSFGSSGEYYMVMSSGEQEQICAAVKAPTLEEKLAFYQARKERKKQQRQQKTSYASEKRRMFNREMEKTYTEQQAMEELFANPPYKDTPWGPAVERYLSSNSESSMCSQSSVNSVVHEQVAVEAYSGCKLDAEKCDSCSCEEPLRRVWSLHETSPQKLGDQCQRLLISL